jgi:CheY-like chemotaxis protein
MQKKILVVEDEFIIAMDIEDTLTRMGYITENKILTGEGAIKRMAVFKPDLLFLDIFLRDNITGLDVAKEAKRKNIPFVFVTASTNESIFKRAKELKPVAIIPKPVTAAKIKEALSNVFM